MPTPPQTGNVRKINVQKFDARSGRLIWSRHVLPPFWPRYRDGTYSIDSIAITNRAASAGVEIEPIHGTNDVVLRLQRYSPNNTPCRHALARVSAWGEVEWLDHIHLGMPAVAPGPFTPRSMAALANGNTLVSGDNEVVIPGPHPVYSTLRETAPDGTSVLSGVTVTNDASGRRLFELPATNTVIASQTIGRLGIPTNTYLTTIENRTRTAINSSNSWGSGVNRPLVLCASHIGLVLSEWRDGGLGMNGSLTANVNQKCGLVLRETTGTFDEIANNVLPAYCAAPAAPPGQPPGSPTGSDPTAYEATCDYYSGLAAAVDGSDIYVAGWWNTFHNGIVWLVSGMAGWYPTGYSITSVPTLFKFNAALNELWRVTRPSSWAGASSPSKIVADSFGCILGVDLTAGRRYALERYDPSGELQWRQSFGSGGLPTDLCLSDDGYLFVVGSTAA